MGKVLIVNSLIASLLVYKMQVLPNMSDNIMTEIQRAIQNFLWSGKKTKILHNILMKDKAQGGLRLANLFMRQKALKIQWITQIVNSEFWSNIFYKQIRYNISNLLWKCNFNKKHVSTIVKDNADVFWIQMLEAWADCNFVKDVSVNKFQRK